MAVRYEKLYEGPRSLLLASLVSSGWQRPYFEAATGWNYGVEDHRFESGTHSISSEDLERLREVVTRAAASDPDFWSDHIRRGEAEASRLLSTVRSLSGLAEDAQPQQDLLEGFAAFAEAVEETAPFLAAAPVVRTVLESLLLQAIAEEVGGPGPHEEAARILLRLRRSGDVSDAVQEVRDCYRIALEVATSEPALELFRTTSPAVALSRLGGELPDLHDLVRRHVDAYGWIRAQGGEVGPLSAKDLVDRIQGIVMRWDAEMITRATAGGEEPPGFAPSGSLGRLIGAFQAVLSHRAFRPGLHLQAECVAGPFLSSVAEGLGVTREQVLFSSAGEIVGGLAGTPLSATDIDARIHNGFTLERRRGDLQVHSHASPAGEPRGPAGRSLTGMSCCRGRAVGVVRVILEASELGRLEVGDVLVTATSTTDLMGGGTVFPVRSGGPAAIGKAAAIVVDEGGLLSHAAIISRERGIPCVVGTERATSSLVDGEVVEVDATRPPGKVIVWPSS